MSVSFPSLQQMPEMISHGEERLIWLLVSEFSPSMAAGCIVLRAGEGSTCTLTARGRTNGQSRKEVKAQEGPELETGCQSPKTSHQAQGSKDRSHLNSNIRGRTHSTQAFNSHSRSNYRAELQKRG